MKNLDVKALEYTAYFLRSLQSGQELEKEMGLYVESECTVNNIHKFYIRGDYPKHVMCCAVYDGLRMAWNIIIYSEISSFKTDEIEMLFDK